MIDFTPETGRAPFLFFLYDGSVVLLNKPHALSTVVVNYGAREANALTGRVSACKLPAALFTCAYNQMVVLVLALKTKRAHIDIVDGSASNFFLRHTHRKTAGRGQSLVVQHKKVFVCLSALGNKENKAVADYCAGNFFVCNFYIFINIPVCTI